jgi:hypothetical protein
MKIISIISKSVFVFLSFFTVQIYAQDYVVTTTNDTLYGEISGLTDYKVRLKQGDIVKKFTSKEINTIFIEEEKKQYVSILMPILNPSFPDPKFVRIIENGKLRLVQIIVRGGGAPNMAGFGGANISFGLSSSNVNWYIQKDRKQRAVHIKGFGALNKEKRKNIIADMIKDNESLFNQFLKEEKYTDELLLAYIKKYNN